MTNLEYFLLWRVLFGLWGWCSRIRQQSEVESDNTDWVSFWPVLPCVFCRHTHDFPFTLCLCTCKPVIPITAQFCWLFPLLICQFGYHPLEAFHVFLVAIEIAVWTHPSLAIQTFKPAWNSLSTSGPWCRWKWFLNQRSCCLAVTRLCQIGGCWGGDDLSPLVNKGHFPSLFFIGNVMSFITSVLKHKDQVENHFNFYLENVVLLAYFWRAK